MKTRLFLLIVSVLFTGCGQTKTQSSNEEIVKMLKDFYTEYITKCSQQPTVSISEDMDVIKKKYCTIRFLDEIFGVIGFIGVPGMVISLVYFATVSPFIDAPRPMQIEKDWNDISLPIDKTSVVVPKHYMPILINN